MHCNDLKAFFLASLLFGSCLQRSGSDLEIYGGEELLKSHEVYPTVVSVGVMQEDIRIFSSICTGVYLGGNTILTAAHCTEREPDVVIFHEDGAGPISRRIQRYTRSISRRSRIAYSHEGASGNLQELAGLNFDMAVFQFVGSLPDGVQPAKILTDPAHFIKGKDVLLVGHGKNEAKDSKRMYVVSKFDRYINHSLFKHIISYGPTPGKGTCIGDSGGPAFIEVDGHWQLAGILHGKSEHINEYYSEDCSEGNGVHTFVAPYIPWINRESNLNLVGNERLNIDEELDFTPAKKSPIREWCDLESVSLQQWTTMLKILAVAKSPDCREAEITVLEEVRQSKVLNFRNVYFNDHEQIVDISPFWVFEDSGLQKIVLQHGRQIADTALNQLVVQIPTFREVQFLDLSKAVRCPAGWQKIGKDTCRI